jgi:hypothetical protein
LVSLYAPEPCFYTLYKSVENRIRISSRLLRTLNQLTLGLSLSPTSPFDGNPSLLLVVLFDVFVLFCSCFARSTIRRIGGGVKEIKFDDLRRYLPQDFESPGCPARAPCHDERKRGPDSQQPSCCKRPSDCHSWCPSQGRGLQWQWRLRMPYMRRVCQSQARPPLLSVHLQPLSPRLRQYRDRNVSALVWTSTSTVASFVSNS